jgi:hypothetical protein
VNYIPGSSRTFKGPPPPAPPAPVDNQAQDVNTENQM